jgi:hypothetical protein
VDTYKVCKEQIDVVEKALEKALSDTGTVAREPARPGRQSPPPPPPDMEEESDGEMPF